MKIYRPDEIKKYLQEGYSGKIKVKPVVVKLACHPDISVEITRPEDQILVCPRCFKRTFLTWSKISGHQRITYEK
jgi:hypothetical protein